MLLKESTHKQVHIHIAMRGILRLLQCATRRCVIFSSPTTAADVFRLNEQPENVRKKLDVCASYFEIYLGKVCTVHHVHIWLLTP